MRMTSTIRVLAILLVAIAAGCGGGGSSGAQDPGDWSDSVCGSIATWATSIRSAARSLEGNKISPGDLTGAANEMRDSTNALADDLKSLNRPDTHAGVQAKASLDKLAAEYRSEVKAMETELRAAAATGAPNSPGAVSRVRGTLIAMGEQLQAAFGDLAKHDTKGELNTAFKNASNCKKLSRLGA